MISANDILVYPNPAKDVLNVYFSSMINGPSSLVIYNTIGEVVIAAAIAGHNSSIDVSDLDAGIYFCRIETGAAFYNKKIVIVK